MYLYTVHITNISPYLLPQKKKNIKINIYREKA